MSKKEDLTPTMITLIHISHYFPKSNSICCIMIILKMLPLLIITHDWNLNAERGLSYWMRNFTLSTAIALIQIKSLWQTIVHIVFVIGVIILCGFFYIRHQIKLYKKPLGHHITVIKIISITIYIIFYLANQHLIAIELETLYCSSFKSKTDYGFILKPIESCGNSGAYNTLISIIGNSLSTLFFSVMIQSMNYNMIMVSNGIIMNSLGSFDFYYIVLPFIQIAIQLEFHLDFFHILLIKHIIRTIYCLFFIVAMFRHKSHFVNYLYDYLFNLFLGMCFFSCLIEWAFYYDKNNYLLNLTNSNGAIILKLVVEFLGAKIMIDYYFKKDKDRLLAFIQGISSMKKNKYHSGMMKLLVVLSNCSDKKAIKAYTDAVMEVLKEKKDNQSNLNSSNEGIDIYQSDLLKSFQEDVYREQQSNFINQMTIQTGLINAKQSKPNIKEVFPLLYDFIHYYLQNSIDKSKRIKSQKELSSIFCLLFFYLAFERNVLKCFRLIELIKSSSFYRNSYIFKVQTQLMEKELFRYYKNCILKEPTFNKYIEELDTMVNCKKIKDMYLSFKSIQNVRLIEEFMKESLNEYIEIMNHFNEEEVTFSQFQSMLKSFKHKFDLTTDHVVVLSQMNQCNISYSYRRYELFYNFFKEKVPQKVSSAISTFFSSNLSILEDQYYLLIIKANRGLTESTSNERYSIDYASDDLKLQLDYTFNEFGDLGLYDLIPSSFLKSYNFIFDEMVKRGKQYFVIKNFCLMDKDKYLLLFDVFSVLIYAGDSLQIFLKLIEAKEQKLSSRGKPSSRRLKRKKGAPQPEIELNDKNSCGNCLLYTNKSGKIISISRDFERFFLLSSGIVSKNKINIKDLLKLETLQEEGLMFIDLNRLYENIIQLNSNEIGQFGGEDEFSQAIMFIKEAQRNILKAGTVIQVEVSYEKKKLQKSKTGKYQHFYLFHLQILRKGLKLNKPNKLVEVDKSLIQTSREKVEEESAPFLRTTFIAINRNDKIKYNLYLSNIIDCQKTILLVKHLSIKLLEMYFKDTSLKTKDNAFKIDKYFPKDTKDSKVSLREKERIASETIKYLHSSQNTNHQSTNAIQSTTDFIIETPLKANNTWKEAVLLYEKIKKKLPRKKGAKLKVVIGLFVSLVVIVLYLMFSIHQVNQIIDDFDIYMSYSYFKYAYFRLVSVLACVLYMQYQANGLQSDVISNHFNNSFQFYTEHLTAYLIEYNLIANNLVSFMQSRVFYTKGAKEALRIVSLPFPFLAMDRKGRKTVSLEPISSINYMSINIRQIELSNGFVIYFNTSDYYVEQVDNYYSQNENIKAIENILGIWRYIMLDVITPIDKIYIEPTFHYQLVLSGILIGLSLFYIIFNYLWLVMFMKTKMNLFAKYFFLFTQLRYFNVLIRKKTQVVLEYLMNNGDSKIDLKELLGNIGLSNSKEDLNDIKKLCSDQLTNIKLIRVQPFKIKMIETPMTHNSSVSETVIAKGNPEFIYAPVDNHSCNSVKRKISTMNPQKKLNNSIMKKISFNSKLSESKLNMFSSVKDLSFKGSKTGSVSISDQNSVYTTTTNKSLIKSSFLGPYLNEMNTSTLQIKKQYDSTGKKLLNKPFSSLGILIFLSLVSLCTLALNGSKYYLTKRSNDCIKDIIEVEATIFGQIDLISEMLIAYQIALLKNDEVTCSYNVSYNSSYCLKGNRFNEEEHHNVFDEIIECVPILKLDSVAFSHGKRLNSFLTNTIQLQSNLDSIGFCEQYCKFLFENKDHLIMRTVNEIHFSSYEEMLSNCKSVGNGFNSEGLNLALESMYTELKNDYIDFRNDQKRNETSNHMRMNKPELLVIQAEYFNVILNVPYVYAITFYSDLDKMMRGLITENIVVIVICILLILVISGYFFFYILRFKSEDELIDFFNDAILNSLLY